MTARYWFCRTCGHQLVRSDDGIRFRHPAPADHEPRPQVAS